MENINTAPVIEPENTLRPEKKFGKPEIFMILAVILSTITQSLSGFFSALFSEPADEIAEKFPEYTSLISTIASGAISNATSVVCTVLSIVVYALFAYFSYKKIGKAFRFLGAVFVATTLMNLFDRTLGLVTLSIIDFYSVKGLLESHLDDFSTIISVIAIIELIINLIVAAAAGVLSLMFFEGKIKFRKKEKSPVPQENINEKPVTEPENTVKRKKKKFGKPEVFMLLSLILTEGVLNIGFNLIRSFVTTVLNMVCPMIISKTGNDETIRLIFEILQNISNYVFNVSEIILVFAVIVIFALLAYKKMKRRAVFLGVVFTATNISWLLLYGPLTFIRNIISSTISAVSMHLLEEGSLRATEYSTITIVQGIVIGLSENIILFIGMVVAVVSGLLIIMALNGKLKKKKKEPEAIETSEITEAN